MTKIPVVDAVIYIEMAKNDAALSFNDVFIPRDIETRLNQNGLCNNIYFAIRQDYTGILAKNANTIIIQDSNDNLDFWNSLLSKSNADHFIRVFGDAPFLDIAIVREMITLHMETLSEYTYSENIPDGFCCDILSRDVFKGTEKVNTSTSVTKSIKSNINQFDVEIFYKDPDIRNKRLSFRMSALRDYHIMQNLYANTRTIPKYSEIQRLLNETPEVLYIGPSYLEIELTDRCDLDCIFCYRQKVVPHRGDIHLPLINKIIADMHAFALPYTICLGGAGEPMMNDNFYQILTSLYNDELIQTIIVETNGIYADAYYRSFIENHAGKIITIININGFDPESYTSIHGLDYYTQVHENVINLTNIKNNQLYLQIMKINETRKPIKGNDYREYIDAYYDYWEKYNVPIILQKQNTFLGIITDRRYSDLTPLDRCSCWHLQRDINILANGDLIFCKQDINGINKIGNIQESSIMHLWNKRKDFFIKDYTAPFIQKPDCQSCDEWHTFNL